MFGRFLSASIRATLFLKLGILQIRATLFLKLGILQPFIIKYPFSIYPIAAPLVCSSPFIHIPISLTGIWIALNRCAVVFVTRLLRSLLVPFPLY